MSNKRDTRPSELVSSVNPATPESEQERTPPQQLNELKGLNIPRTGRLLTHGDAFVEPGCKVHPAQQLGYDILPRNVKDAYDRANVVVPKQATLINFLKQPTPPWGGTPNEDNLRDTGIEVTEDGKTMYMCPQRDCNYGPATGPHIRDHLLNKKHLGWKNYPCAFCGTCFIHSNDRAKHQKKAHPDTTAADGAASNHREATYQPYPVSQHRAPRAKNVRGPSAQRAGGREMGKVVPSDSICSNPEPGEDSEFPTSLGPSVLTAAPAEVPPPYWPQPPGTPQAGPHIAFFEHAPVRQHALPVQQRTQPPVAQQPSAPMAFQAQLPQVSGMPIGVPQAVGIMHGSTIINNNYAAPQRNSTLTMPICSSRPGPYQSHGQPIGQSYNWQTLSQTPYPINQLQRSALQPPGLCYPSARNQQMYSGNHNTSLAYDFNHPHIGVSPSGEGYGTDPPVSLEDSFQTFMPWPYFS